MPEKNDSQLNPEPALKQIRTFQGDVANALQNQQESLVSIQQAEHLKKDSVSSTNNTLSPDSKRRIEFFFLILGSLLLFILGTVGAWYAYNEFVKKTTVPITIAPANKFISTNAEINLDLTNASRGTLISALSDATENVPPGEIKHVVLRKKDADNATFLLPTNEFLNILESHAPGFLVRAFDPLFMFGSLGNSTFLIIRLVSFENAFAGMLEWEIDMAADIGPLFATAQFLRDVPPEAVFTDVADKNKDVRRLALGDQTILLYSFFDNNMLIITDNIETLRTLIDRLTREKLSR